MIFLNYLHLHLHLHLPFCHSSSSHTTSTVFFSFFPLILSSSPFYLAFFFLPLVIFLLSSYFVIFSLFCLAFSSTSVFLLILFFINPTLYLHLLPYLILPPPFPLFPFKFNKRHNIYHHLTIKNSISHHNQH